MKLRNKKTGKIEEIVGYVKTSDNRMFFRFEDDTGTYKKEYNSLAKLNSEWEDYEESKKYWYIGDDGEVYGFSNYFVGSQIEEAHREIGNLFETKEQAEKAVEKLKAAKRLKDKGIKIIDYECCGGVNKKGEFLGEVRVTIDVPQEVDKYLFETLFGGEE